MTELSIADKEKFPTNQKKAITLVEVGCQPFLETFNYQLEKDDLEDFSHDFHSRYLSVSGKSANLHVGVSLFIIVNGTQHLTIWL